MSFGKINKIIKFVDKYVKNNQLENITHEEYHTVIENITKEANGIFEGVTHDIIIDIVSKKYEPNYNFKQIVSFDDGKNCFPEFMSFYPDVEIPPEFQKLEDHFQKLKALPQPEQRTKEWFDYRHNRITASDTAAAIDENPYEPVEGFILKKCDPDHQFLDNANVYHGKKFELIATKIYEHIYNTQVVEFGALPSENYLLLGASPDGICSSRTLDNKFSNKLGTMLEIKCVAPNGRTIETHGEIKGNICPYYYYLQVQQQLECCELEICDFWQCKLIEYKTRKEYLIDKCTNTVHTHSTSGKKMSIDNLIKKGMLLQFYPFKWEPQFEGDSREWKSKFIYPPRLDMTTKQYDEWFIKTMTNLHSENADQETKDLMKDYYFHKIIYWKLEQSHNQPIQRDRVLFAKILPVLEETWKRVEYYRKNLGKLDELKEIVERRKKYIRTPTDFNINNDIIKNNVLFLDLANSMPAKVKSKPVPKNLKQEIDCDFVDEETVSTKPSIKSTVKNVKQEVDCDFLDDEITSTKSKTPVSKSTKTTKPKKKVVKDESDKADKKYKEYKSVFPNSTKNADANCDFLD